MKSIVLSICALFAVTFASVAAPANIEVKTYPVKSNYAALEVSGMVEVILTDGPKNSIKVEAPSFIMPDVSIIVKGETLKISCRRDGERGTRRNFQNAKVRVYVSGEGLRSFELSGMSQLEAEDVVLKAPTLNFTLTGMSSVDADKISCDNLKLDISGMSKFVGAQLGCRESSLVASGMSKVNLAGKVERAMTVNVSGMSKVDVSGLDVETATVDVSGMSKLNMSVDEQVTGDVSGMSKVTCRGNCRSHNCRVDKMSSFNRL